MDVREGERTLFGIFCALDFVKILPDAVLRRKEVFV